MATLFVIVLHLTAHGWKVADAYQSRPDTNAMCLIEKERFTRTFKPQRGERYDVFCQAEPKRA